LNYWLCLALVLTLVLRPAGVVTIASFYAQGYADRVEVFWETASEIDNAGFNLYRDTSPTGSFGLKLNSVLIPSQVPPGSPFGASYQFTDSNVEPGVTYYYRLEAIDLQGHSQPHNELASATVPAAATVTPTFTPTPTPSPSVTPTLPGATTTPTDTPTASPAPTATASPTTAPSVTPTPSVTAPASVTPTPSVTAPASVTPAASATRRPGATASPTSPPLSATPTLLPLPSVTGTALPASPLPGVTETPVPTSPGPSPTATQSGPSVTPTSFPTVAPVQPAPLSGLCVRSVSYIWLIAGAALLLAVTALFAVLMTRRRS